MVILRVAPPISFLLNFPTLAAEHDFYLLVAEQLLQGLGAWLMWLPPSDAADHLTAIYHSMLADIRDIEEVRA
jgi:hypothetical protein